MGDEKLVTQLNRDNPESFYAIMEKYNKLLWIVAGSVLGNVGTYEDIEDCVSDVYLELWKKPELFDPEKGSIKSFLTVVARNKAIDRYRQLSKVQTIELDEHLPSEDNDLIDYIIKKDKFNDLHKAIIMLNHPDREILTRRYFLDEKPAVIANVMSLPVKEVENRLYQSHFKKEQADIQSRLNCSSVMCVVSRNGFGRSAE
ncbi:MAG: sigma-70 family RNA polymerase sigma factor [Oscillospiraceae bacterium]|nr:sigma-70 family RNA polymerase sigma factor [Oscillospiraceae bacterium]